MCKSRGFFTTRVSMCVNYGGTTGVSMCVSHGVYHSGINVCKSGVLFQLEYQCA